MNHYQTAAFVKATKMKQSPFNRIFPPKVEARCQHTSLKEYEDKVAQYTAELKEKELI